VTGRWLSTSRLLPLYNRVVGSVAAWPAFQFESRAMLEGVRKFLERLVLKCLGRSCISFSYTCKSSVAERQCKQYAMDLLTHLS
jgi:hypothetical protein